MHSKIAGLQQRVIDWVEQQDSIRALLLVGSQARIDHPADEWSDLDLILFCREYDHFLADTRWLNNIAEVWVCIASQIGTGEPELLAVFEGGLKVDFVFIQKPLVPALTDSALLRTVCARGFIALLDKDDEMPQLALPEHNSAQHTLPSEAEFSATVEQFWYNALYVAKQVRRQQLWLAKDRDWAIKKIMLRLLEWHT
ncbi:MAG: aminoglycoside 6-adenylyltransferase, partial [Anaerolineae bacterium]|nr:aminoglycoside 6-adenylyltransferase [Anaerolineae bacterium]